MYKREEGISPAKKDSLVLRDGKWEGGRRRAVFMARGEKKSLYQREREREAASLSQSLMDLGNSDYEAAAAACA